ncbi:unnamed protein product [Lampetra planeri]
MRERVQALWEVGNEAGGGGGGGRLTFIGGSHSVVEGTGDEILITASGFSFQENEVRMVASVADNKITLTAPLEFSHWASSDGTMASDVVLLSRDLVVEMKSSGNTSGSAPAWIYLEKNQTSDVSIKYTDFHFPSEPFAGAVQPFSLFSSENVTKANIKFSVFRGGSGPSIKIAGKDNVLENCVVFNTSGSGNVNEAHSGLYGVYVTGNCDKDVIVRDFLVWKSWNYGVYIQASTIIGASSDDTCGNVAPQNGYMPDKLNALPVPAVKFMNFVSTCQGNSGSAAIATNGLSEDFQHPIVIKGTKLQNVNDKNKIYMHVAQKTVALGCPNAACDGKRTALLTDTDGSFLGTEGTAVPTADNIWGDPSLGIGDNWVPKIALTLPNNSMSTLASIASKKGVFMDGCTDMVTWWNCNGVHHAVLAMQSMDADFTSRPFSPAALLSPNYVNVLNGPPLHKMESCPKDGPCLQTTSVFHGIVNTADCHTVYFLRYPPHAFRLTLLSGKPDTTFKVGLFYPKDLRFRGFNNYYRILYLNLHAGDLVDLLISNTAGISFTARNTTAENAPTADNIRKSVAAKTNYSNDKIEIQARKRRSSTDDLDPIIYITIIADINDGNLDDAALNINSKAGGQGDSEAQRQGCLGNLRDKLTASVLSGQLSADLGFDLSNISVVDPLPAVGSSEWTEVTYTDVIFESPYMSSLYGLRIFSFPKKMLAGKSFLVMVQAIDKNFIINQNTQYQVSTNPFSVEEERALLAKNVASIIVGGILGALVFIVVGAGGFCCHRKRKIQENGKPPMM